MRTHSIPPRALLGQSFVLVALLGLILWVVPDVARAESSEHQLQCDTTMADACRRAVPGATRFEGVEGKPYLKAFDKAGKPLGWVALSTDLVDIKAYSGKPMVTVVGLDPQGVISGARVVHHSEPILLVGIPIKKLHDFVDLYANVAATTHVVVGESPDSSALTVDVISGATVTALAQNQTLLETARVLGTAVGVVKGAELNPGKFVQDEQPWTWPQMMAGAVFGRLSVTEAQMGASDQQSAFVDIWFTVVDAPHIGRALLGDSEYKYHMGRLVEGEHLIVVLGNGSSSFKGSGFVRGGIFDRVRVEQGLGSVVFRDTDYTNFTRVAAAGAPDFNEGAIFVSRESRLDPGAPFDFIFLGSVYDGQGGFSRSFKTFNSTFQLPASVYKLDNPPRDLKAEMVSQAWYNNRIEVYALAAFLFLVTLLFVARKFLTSKMKRLERIHITVMLVSFVGIGLVMHVQPSVTQILTAVGSAVGDWDWGLFLSEPLLFVFWIFIGIVTFIWGRGVFCGWVCPYGAMSELLFKLGKFLGVKKAFELSDRIHFKARYLRYVVLVVLLAVFLDSPETGEQLAEIEPFKSTFYVAPWTREWYYFGWWAMLAVASIFWFRPFCRYLCPLGAALALPSSFRLTAPLRRNFCSSCKICARGCEPRAIAPNGTIDDRECLQCMECEANYRAEEVCPPLIGIERLQLSALKLRGEPDPARMARLENDLERIPRWGSKREGK